ncbi:hypothetical protein HYH02_012716 [Chlamydomonas schloesseri]|uniref:Lysosomal Pro-X carboxypeptidase n=1 Tax=Chlamydomonas schloesseri TaxID=2026947 RepID=A0A835SZW7_9CHLO|nr:hypothetical protein HYH02_012716 [Chlamydomonas schloesseri]|eukprot:KAG2433173.1 hypothetical protein HYH02_012716 [Chlamydomonas schloesseri]
MANRVALAALVLAVASLTEVHAMLTGPRHIRLGDGRSRQLQRPFSSVATHSLRKDLLAQCKLNWRNASLDHFSRVPPAGDITTFPQRYFVCASHWQRETADGTPGPVFFYLGNEADVTLYLNNTGLMWESAADFGAMLVFAEHRYYGESVPYGKAVKKHMGYLSAEQAMADYAQLIMELKEQYQMPPSTAVIGFGGSYGGMLAAWMRLKYPHVLDGAIAASAPIWNFLGEVPAFDPGSFAKGVTYDASELAGSAPACVDNVKATWDLLASYGGDDAGRKFLAGGLRLCPGVPLKSAGDVEYLRAWLGAAWDYMAMGNFPYPSSYITNGHGLLPAFPVRAACEPLAGGDDWSDADLLDAMAAAVGVFYNHTGDLACFDPFAGTDPDSDHDANWWDYQWCAEMLMPFAKDGDSDMFWPEPFDLGASVEACQDNWGVTPRPLWATTQWGGRRIAAGSNIVFSNGLLDPWHGGGVLEDISDSMPAVIIPEGAHHLDLMFSHPDDPLSVIEVRKFQRESIRDWIQQAAQQSPSVDPTSGSSSLPAAGGRFRQWAAAAAAAGAGASATAGDGGMRDSHRQAHGSMQRPLRQHQQQRGQHEQQQQQQHAVAMAGGRVDGAEAAVAEGGAADGCGGGGGGCPVHRAWCAVRGWAAAAWRQVWAPQAEVEGDARARGRGRSEGHFSRRLG